MGELALLLAVGVSSLPRPYPYPVGPAGPLPIPRPGNDGNYAVDNSFKAKLKWHDAYGGHGEHYYDYNHGDSYGKEPAYHEPAPAYNDPEPPTYLSGSEPVPA